MHVYWEPVGVFQVHFETVVNIIEKQRRKTTERHQKAETSLKLRKHCGDLNIIKKKQYNS